MATQPVFAGDKSPRRIQMTNAKSGDRLNIGLRTTKIESELRSSKLPTDTKAIIEGLVKDRELNNDTIYRQTLRFVQLQKKGNFWTEFGFSSIDEFLSQLDLPCYQTLAVREVIVQVFSKDTFLLIGDHVLGIMMNRVIEFQPSKELRLKDYKAIFKAYCDQYSAFDKTSFVSTVNTYVNNTYRATEHVKDPHKRPPKLTPKGISSAKRARFTSDPDMPKDIIVETVVCGGCSEKQRTLDIALSYIRTLERELSIRGVKKLDRPEEITHLLGTKKLKSVA